jgi:hypothetical protein
MYYFYMKYFISILFLIFIIFLLFIIFFFINKKLNYKEHYCKIPYSNPSGTLNDKKVFLDNYNPQTDIFTSSCDQYWKDWPLESNNTMIEDNPIVINSDQLKLPKEQEFGNNNYIAGLLDFNKLTELTNDKIDYDIFERSSELLINPITKEKLRYKYELDFFYIEHNKKTWINRWQKYNPNIKIYFNYNDIKSPIENINILNLEFTGRCYINQKDLLTKKQLYLFGLIIFDIFKYKILHINYLNNDENIPVYIMEISLYRESDLYLNTFSYIGYINDNNIKITNVKYIGRNSTDSVLLSDYYDPTELKQQIINTNFDNKQKNENNPDVIVEITKKEKEDFKLKNQYACFNLNYSPSRNNEYILQNNSREKCESSYDTYGRQKEVGIYDTPCKKNDECPFYKMNKNYDNDFGKCLDNGYCELPVNMNRIGYKYYTQNNNELPLCYNCETFKYSISSGLDTCCNEQYNKDKYPHLKSPDFAFKNDNLTRKNFFNHKFCKEKINTLLTCEDIVL